jgi:uncharacterized protein
MIAELADVLSRVKFSVASQSVNRFINLLIRQATVIPVDSNLKIAPEDPDDDVMLNTAISGKADYVVSGDKHLLKIGYYKSIQIVSVKDFAEMQSKKVKDQPYHYSTTTHTALGVFFAKPIY